MDFADLPVLFLSHFFRIVLILLLGLAAWKLIDRVAPRIIRALLWSHKGIETPEERAKREETLVHVVQWSANTLLLFVVGLTVLGELGVDVTPALASVGVVGVALGFGAQSLVQDTISGIFILLENQYRKGDVARVAGVAGLVEEVNLRRTVLRDLDGIVHSVPNGQIGVASNYTRDWSRVNLNVSVAYSTDVDKAQAVINRVGQEMAEDPVFGEMITEPPQFLRVDAMEDSGIALKVLGVTKPIMQWEVMGELRRRLLVAFAAEGIEIPLPHRVVISRAEDGGPQAQPATPGREPALPADMSERLPGSEEQ